MKIKLIVGLGNPGRMYEKTRHNVGFRVLDIIFKNLNAGKWKERKGALFFDEFIGFDKVIFLKPQRFMNLSGGVVLDFVKFYNIPLEDIIIISDDLDLPLGTIKLKEKGSSGGHNGLKDIEANLKTQEYRRIKIGISNNKEIDTKDYVLGRFSKEEEKVLKPVLEQVANIILNENNKSFQELMSMYNKKIKNN